MLTLMKSTDLNRHLGITDATACRYADRLGIPKQGTGHYRDWTAGQVVGLWTLSELAADLGVGATMPAAWINLAQATMTATDWWMAGGPEPKWAGLAGDVCGVFRGGYDDVVKFTLRAADLGEVVRVLTLAPVTQLVENELVTLTA